MSFGFQLIGWAGFPHGNLLVLEQFSIAALESSPPQQIYACVSVFSPSQGQVCHLEMGFPWFIMDQCFSPEGTWAMSRDVLVDTPGLGMLLRSHH